MINPFDCLVKVWRAQGEYNLEAGLLSFDADLRKQGGKCPKCGLDRCGVRLGEQTPKEAGICSCREKAADALGVNIEDVMDTIIHLREAKGTT